MPYWINFLVRMLRMLHISTKICAFSPITLSRDNHRLLRYHARSHKTTTKLTYKSHKENFVL